MLELLAAIQEVEPTAWPLVAIMLSSVAMYAVGILMPCSTCCGCGLCLEGSLPDTVTVAISGYVDGQLTTEQLGFVDFASNFGNGASAIIAAPTGTPGPITAVTVTNGGSGYARLARVQPQTQVIPPATGSGATFNVTLEQFQFDGRTAWRIGSVAITSAGSGYFGFSRVFSVTASNGVTVLEGAFSAQVDVAAPSLSLTIPAPGDGIGATLEPVLTEYTDYFGNQKWAPNSVTVTSPGSGYETGREVRAVLGAGTQGSTQWRAYITEVDANGGIIAVTVTGQYQWYGFYGSTGAIASVAVQSHGIFYKDDATVPGEVATITATARQWQPGGIQDQAANGAVLQAVVDNAPASPTFGKITGVTVVNGGEGYSAWKYREYACCADYWNGKTLVLKRKRDNTDDFYPVPPGPYDPKPNACVYEKWLCGTTGGSGVRGGGGRSLVSVEYRGTSLPPIVRVDWRQKLEPCYTEAVATANIADCDEFTFTATSKDGVTFSVTPGGEFNTEEHYNTFKRGNCFPCCRDLDDVPDEITANLFKKNNVTNVMELQGTYVLSRWQDNSWRLVLEELSPSNGEGKIIEVFIDQCQRGPWVHGESNDALDGSYPGDTVGCADCWKKCTVVAAWFQMGVGLYRSDRCVGCVTSPMCSPTPGTRQLRKVRFFTTAADGPDVQVILQNGPVGDYAIEVEA